MAFHVARHAAQRAGGVPRPRPAAALADSFTISALTAIIGACIFLQRFAVPVGASQVPAAFVVAYLVFIALLLRGRLVVSTGLFALFMATMALMTCSLIVSATKSSLMSYLYLFSIYGLYVFKLKYQRGCFRTALNTYLNMMAICAACGIAQFALQFVIGAELVFPIDTFAPGSFLLDGYNVIIPLEYLSTTMKSNGVFFLEPSFFSQFLGVALIIELLVAQRIERLLLYAAAMVVSYSGTGLILVLVILPWAAMKRGNAKLIVAGAVLAFALAMIGGNLDLERWVDRLGEFSSPESSGFARFISPYYLMRDFVIKSPGTLLFGMGPGAIETVEKEATTLAYDSHDPTWIKLVLEYGLVAATMFMTFIATALFHGTRNRILSWSILCLYLFLGGYLLNGFMHFVFVSLLAWHNQTAAVKGPVGDRRMRMRRTPFPRRRPVRPIPVG